jgi:tetratricopeptide (TPR) repeat protein
MVRASKRVDESQNKFPFWAWCLFFLGFWQILLWAQNPSLMSDDSGEMIAASYRLGISHPPGYPLFCLLGRLFSFIPVGTVAFRFNLLSGLFVLFSLCFLGLSCLAFLKIDKKSKLTPRFGITAVLLGLVFLFSCRSVFSQALTAKGCVYTLTLCFLSVFLWFRVKSHENELSASLVLFVLFLWALGLSNHWESEVLWGPFIVYWFYQEKTHWDVKRVFQALSVIVVGLSLYLYLPLRAALGVLPSWGDPKSLSGFMWVITRESYRGLEPLFRNASFYLSFLKEYFDILLAYWMPGFVIVALIGLFYLWRNIRKLFFSTLILYLPVVLAILAVPREETKFLMTVYLVSTQGVVAFWGFVGIFFVMKKLFELNSRFSVWAVILLFVFGSFWIWQTFKKEDKSQYCLASDFSINALKSLPEKSIFLAEGDNYVVPLFYERFVEGFRKDIVFLPSIFLFHDWGWRQLAAQDPGVASAIKSSTRLSGRIEALAMVNSGGGLFNTMDRAYLGSVAMNGNWVPWALERFWIKDCPKPTWIFKKVLFLAGTERFRGVTAEYDPGDVTTFEIHHYYANQYFSTGGWLHEKGDWEDALHCFELGLTFYPKAAYAYAYMGAVLGSEGYLEMAKRLCLLGIEADPSYFGSYENLANVYRRRGEELKVEECYQMALNRANDRGLTEVHIKDLERMNSGKTQIIVKDKTSLEYRVLGNHFKKQGMLFLGGLAERIGQVSKEVSGD